MTDLTNLPADMTAEQFFDDILYDILGDVDIPDNLGHERMQFNVTGDDGGSYHIGMEFDDEEDDDVLTIEEGQTDSPPVAVTVSLEDFQHMLAGDLRDRFLDELGDAFLNPKLLKHAFLPDSVVQKIKSLSGNLQIRIEDKESGDVYVATGTLGGDAPNIDSPTCTVIIDVATMLEIAQRKADPQQLFMQGRIRIDGDMSIVLQLMGLLNG
ncbi:MAG: SCP2 sterol-binding domain-containing protein [Myxococcota bacterium]|nr:SCP2 sterol-binding domain-containing protein [Myxococcota bacterium]